MNEMIAFAIWCMENKKYVYDSAHGWFHRKSMKIITWEELYDIYAKQLKK